MVIAPDKVDAYLQAKGILPRMNDAEWATSIGVLTPFLKSGRWFRVKLLHQKEDSLRRYSLSFPDSIPAPYRFIDYVEFSIGGSLPEEVVIGALKSHGIPFTKEDEPNGPEDDDVVTIIRVGPPQTL